MVRTAEGQENECRIIWGGGGVMETHGRRYGLSTHGRRKSIKTYTLQCHRESSFQLELMIGEFSVMQRAYMVITG